MSCVCACTCCSAHMVLAFAPCSGQRSATSSAFGPIPDTHHATHHHLARGGRPPSTCTFAEVLNCSQGVRRFPTASVCSVGARVVRFSALDSGMLATHLDAVSLSKVPVGTTAVSQVARSRSCYVQDDSPPPPQHLFNPSTNAWPPRSLPPICAPVTFFLDKWSDKVKMHIISFSKTKKLFFTWRENTHASDASLHTTNLKAPTNWLVESLATGTSLPTLPKPS